MPIAQMREYAKLRAEGSQTITARLALLEAHRTSLHQQIALLRVHEKALDTKIAVYRHNLAKLHTTED